MIWLQQQSDNIYRYFILLILLEIAALGFNTTDNLFVLSGMKSAAEMLKYLQPEGNKRLSPSSWSFLIITYCISILLNSVSTHFIPNSCDWDHPIGITETQCVRSTLAIYSSAFMKGFWMKFGIITWIVLQRGATHSISFLKISLESLGLLRQNSPMLW